MTEVITYKTVRQWPHYKPEVIASHAAGFIIGIGYPDEATARRVAPKRLDFIRTKGEPRIRQKLLDFEANQPNEQLTPKYLYNGSK